MSKLNLNRDQDKKMYVKQQELGRNYYSKRSEIISPKRKYKSIQTAGSIREVNIAMNKVKMSQIKCDDITDMDKLWKQFKGHIIKVGVQIC